MSFSESFHPDNVDGLTTIEKARYVPGKSVDGAEVGGNTPQDKTDKTSKNKEYSEGDKKKPEKKIPSIDETQTSINEGKLALKNYAKEDPSRLALQEQGPEAIREGEIDVLKKWP